MKIKFRGSNFTIQGDDKCYSVKQEMANGGYAHYTVHSTLKDAMNHIMNRAAILEDDVKEILNIMQRIEEKVSKLDEYLKSVNASEYFIPDLVIAEGVGK